jgi:hypothetical protein
VPVVANSPKAIATSSRIRRMSINSTLPRPEEQDVICGDDATGNLDDRSGLRAALPRHRRNIQERDDSEASGHHSALRTGWFHHATSRECGQVRVSELRDPSLHS